MCVCTCAAGFLWRSRWRQGKPTHIDLAVPQLLDFKTLCHWNSHSWWKVKRNRHNFCFLLPFWKLIKFGFAGNSPHSLSTTETHTLKESHKLRSFPGEFPTPALLDQKYGWRDVGPRAGEAIKDNHAWPLSPPFGIVKRRSHFAFLHI